MLLKEIIFYPILFCLHMIFSVTIWSSSILVILYLQNDTLLYIYIISFIYFFRQSYIMQYHVFPNIIVFFVYVSWFFSIPIIVYMGYYNIYLMIITLLCCKYVPENFMNIKDFLELSQHYFNVKYYLKQNEYNNQSLFLMHPHGVFCTSFIIMKMKLKLNHIKFCQSSQVQYLSFLYMFSRLLSNYSFVDKKTMLNNIRDGYSQCILPGGFEEAAQTEYGIEKIYIKNKKGFIKLALQHGQSLIPIYAFNETKLFYNFSNQIPALIRNFLVYYKIPVVIPFGSIFCPILPVNNNFEIIIGEEITLPTIQNPTNEDIDKYHTLYVEKLVELYNEGRVIFNLKCNDLIIE